MKKLNLILFIISFLPAAKMSFSQVVKPPYEIATWQGFRQGAVCFTFDDNCPNQLSVVMPMFDRLGYKMTFFTVISWGPNWTALQNAANNGHEVGSHTVSHTSLGSLPEADQTNELKNSQAAINSNISGQKCLTIAYPNCVAGDENLCSRYYVAARGCSGQIERSTPEDFMNISSIACGVQGSIQTASDFNNKMRAVAASNGLIVFLIHAIDNEPGYSPTQSASIQGALEYLAQNDSVLWESTFSNITRYIKERNNVMVNELSATDSLITFTLSDTLDPAIYNYPLTIRREMPQGWQSFTAAQHDTAINSSIVEINSKKYITFNAVPDSSIITIANNAITGIREDNKSGLKLPELKQNYPNPFSAGGGSAYGGNPSTKISYTIPNESMVVLKIFDVTGKEVTTLVNESRPAGNYEVDFSPKIGSASGVYFYRLQTGNYSNTKKFIMMK